MNIFSPSIFHHLGERFYAFAEQHISTMREHDRARTFPRDVVRGIAEAGWLGVCLPQRYGGMGEDYLALAALAEALEFADSSLRETLAALRADNRPSAPLRLAGHMMDATLMVVALPVGAAMMTYGLVRGGDVYRSGRMLALCGIGMVALEGLGGPGVVSTLLPSL